MQSANFTRRSMLGLLGGSAALPLLRPFRGSALAAEAGTLTIAYNVNLPSFDPTVGASAVNPTIQSLNQAGAAHQMGVERRPHQVRDGGARRRHLA